MGRMPEKLPFRGDERPQRVVIEFPLTGEVAFLTDGINTRGVPRDRLTWGGDFAHYNDFKDKYGRWPNQRDQLRLRLEARKEAFASGIELREEEPDSKPSRN